MSRPAPRPGALWGVFSLLLLFPASGAAQTGGSIYTTDSRGREVNLNVFDSARDVYLGGGPGVNAPCSFRGLDDGDYYFQVTTTSGGVLLTPDPIEDRRVTVSGGVFRSYAGTRRTRPGPCGSILIQLFPFLEPPSGARQYKVWATPVEDYGPASLGAHGFASSNSKTDNFRVLGPGRPVESSAIRGAKFYDYDGDGLWSPGVPEEVAIPGWRIELREGGVLVDVTFTDGLGAFEFLRDRDGTVYEVVEVPPDPGFVPAQGARWYPTTTLTRAAVASVEVVHVGDFGNLSFTDDPVEGLATSKGFWHNAGEPLLRACDPDWRVAVNGSPLEPFCLRRPISSPDPLVSIFTVPPPPAPFEEAFGELAEYLVGNAASGHAGFLLSVQVCATSLNRACGPLSAFGAVAVDVRSDDRLVPLEVLFAGARGLLCDPRAGETAPGENEDLRAMMLGCINEFEQVNTSGSGSTYVPSPTPMDFGSPYGTEL